MAHHTLQAPAPNIPLEAGMQLRLEAINPTTDASVAGVVATRWLIYGEDVSGGGLTEHLIPTLTPEEVSEV